MAIGLIKLLTAASAVALIGAIGIHGLGGAARTESKIDQKITDVLTEIGAEWVQADVDGQAVRLSGVAPSVEAASQVESAVRRAIGPGGLVFGAVTVVKTETSLATPQETPAEAVPQAAPFSAMAEATIEETNAAFAQPHSVAMALEERPAGTSGGDETIADAASASLQSELSETERIAECEAQASRLLQERPILFASKEAVVDADQLQTLDDLADAINQCPDIQVIVEGHSDSSGRASQNKTLSLERANSVADYLRRKIDASSTITAEGFGETRPIVSNASPVGRTRNRRIEIRLESLHMADDE